MFEKKTLYTSYVSGHRIVLAEDEDFNIKGFISEGKNCKEFDIRADFDLQYFGGETDDFIDVYGEGISFDKVADMMIEQYMEEEADGEKAPEVVIEEVEAEGTSFMGDVDMSYDELVGIFGQPNEGASGDGKVKVEWTGKIGGEVFTLYDYKSEVSPEENRDWHIGGFDKGVAEKLKAYIEKSKGIG